MKRSLAQLAPRHYFAGFDGSAGLGEPERSEKARTELADGALFELPDPFLADSEALAEPFEGNGLPREMALTQNRALARRNLPKEGRDLGQDPMPGLAVDHAIFGGRIGRSQTIERYDAVGVRLVGRHVVPEQKWKELLGSLGTQA